jgi:ABC-2 type transport system ATP-binding protein
MAALEVVQLCKRFGRVEALRGVSFSVEPGEVFGYLGPNGAGKTTTLRIILGLVRPSSGSVKLLGGSPADVSARNSVGYLPGELKLYGDMAGGDLLDYLAAFHQHKPPVLRQQLLSDFQVEPAVLSRKIKFLSHGTRQKIGLIAAMQHDPDLLLLDEPTNGLDPLVQQVFRETVRAFALRGRAVFFSSHVLSEAESVCGRVAILREGRILKIESIEKLQASVLRRMKIRLRDAAAVDWSALPGVARVESAGRELSLWIQGDVNAILRCLGQYDVEHFSFPEPELEDIFLGYYQPGGAENG